MVVRERIKTVTLRWRVSVWLVGLALLVSIPVFRAAARSTLYKLTLQRGINPGSSEELTPADLCGWMDIYQQGERALTAAAIDE
jgi:hypothetical protein